MKLISNEALRGVDTSDLPLPFEIFKDFNDANTPDSLSLDLRITSSAPAITSTDNIVLEGTTAFSMRDLLVDYGTCDAKFPPVSENAASTVTSMEGSESGSTTTMDIASNATIFVEIYPKNPASLATTTKPATATATAILDREDTAISPPLAAVPTGSAKLPVAAPAHRFEEAGSAEELHVASPMMLQVDAKVEPLLDTSHHDVVPPDPQPANHLHNHTPGLEHHHTDQAPSALASSSRYWAATEFIAGLAILLSMCVGLRLAAEAGDGQPTMARFPAGESSPEPSFFSDFDSGDTANLHAARSPPRRRSSDSTNASDGAAAFLSPPRRNRHPGRRTPVKSRELLLLPGTPRSTFPKPRPSSPAGWSGLDYEVDGLRAEVELAHHDYSLSAQRSDRAFSEIEKKLFYQNMYTAALEEALVCGDGGNIGNVDFPRGSFDRTPAVSLETLISAGPLSEGDLLHMLLNVSEKLHRAGTEAAEGDKALAERFDYFIKYDPASILVPAGAGLRFCVLAVGPRDIAKPEGPLTLKCCTPGFGEPAYRDPLFAAVQREMRELKLDTEECRWMPWQVNMWTLGIICYRCCSPGGCLPRGYNVEEVNSDASKAATYYEAMVYARAGDKPAAEKTAGEVDGFSVSEGTKALIRDLLAVPPEEGMWSKVRMACSTDKFHRRSLDMERPSVSQVISRTEELLRQLQGHEE